VCGAYDILAFIRHAAAVIDYQPYGGRCVFRLKNPDLLLTALFVNTEVLFGQTGHRPPVAIQNSDVKEDKINVD
jgi:hypothetical protein